MRSCIQDVLACTLLFNYEFARFLLQHTDMEINNKHFSTGKYMVEYFRIFCVLTLEFKKRSRPKMNKLKFK